MASIVPPYQPRNRESGSIQLVAIGFSAALVVLLAIPLVEALVGNPLPNESAQTTTVPPQN